MKESTIKRKQNITDNPKNNYSTEISSDPMSFEWTIDREGIMSGSIPNRLHYEELLEELGITYEF